MKRTGSFLTFLILFFAVPALLADVKVQSLVDRNEMGVGDSFTLQVTVSSDQTVSINAPSLPTIPGVQLINQWSSNQTRSSVVSTPQGMDFKTIQTKIFNYQFVVNQKGVIKIDEIGVTVGGKIYNTKPITLNVQELGKAPRQARKTPPNLRQPTRPRWPKDPIDRMEEQFNQLLKRSFPGGVAPGTPGSFSTTPGNPNEAFFVMANVDKTTAYKGEQITASWYIYTKGRVRDIDTLKYPTLKGFWKEDIQISTHLNFEQDVVNGIPYNRALLTSYALFPIEEGKAKIDPYKLKATIISGFGFGKGYTGTKASRPIPIAVLPLPAEGRPESFSGAVGEFQMKVEIEDKSVVSHQPFALKIRFEGRGNAKLIELPSLNLPEGLEIYDVKNESKFFKNGQSYKEFEVLLIPRVEGELTLPALKNSYFSPKTKKYVRLESQPLRLNILPGTKQQSIGEERLKPKEAEARKTLPGLIMEWDPDYQPVRDRSLWWLIAFSLVFLALMTKLCIDLGVFEKQPDLKDEVKKRFGGIHSAIQKKEFRQVGIDVTNTVYHVLGEVSGQGGAHVELNKLLAKTAPSVRREIEAPLRKLMDYFGVLGFGPKKVVAQINDSKEIREKVKSMEALMFKAIRLNRGQDKVDEK